MYKYFGFGLKIQSEIEFPELKQDAFDTPDVTIQFGDVPRELDGEKFETADYYYAINDTEYVFNVNGVCAYYARRGDNMIISPYHGADERSIRIYILGSMMAAIVLQRGMLPLHASAIINNDKLVLFTGHSGAGKSTTLAQLALKGYEIFTDDLCILKRKVTADGGGSITAYASYPMMKLWKDASQRLKSAAFNKEDFNVRDGLEKYGHFFFDQFSTKAYPVSKIFVLTKDPLPQGVLYQQLSGIAAFKELEVTIFRRHQIHNNSLRTLYFNIITQLTAECLIYKINMQAGFEEDGMLREFPENLLE